MFHPNVTSHRRPGRPRTPRVPGVLVLCLALVFAAAALPAPAAAAAPANAADGAAPWWATVTGLWSELLDEVPAGPAGAVAVAAGNEVDPQYRGVADPDGETTEDCIDCVDPQHGGILDPNG